MKRILTLRKDDRSITFVNERLIVVSVVATGFRLALEDVRLGTGNGSWREMYSVNVWREW